MEAHRHLQVWIWQPLACWEEDPYAPHALNLDETFPLDCDFALKKPCRPFWRGQWIKLLPAPCAAQSV